MNLMETPVLVAASPSEQSASASQTSRLGLVLDYVQLAKPRLTTMVLFTVAVGFFAAAMPGSSLLPLLHALLGTALVAAGAGALNQLLEKDADAIMRRTRRRPLPAGRLSPSAVLRFGVMTSCLGLGYLATLVNPSAAAVAGLTLALYVFAYTPLKRITALNTMIGAVPGALPPVIGVLAAGGGLDFVAGILFLIVFLWQFPHFWAIAWLYRDDYRRAGLQMLSTQDSEDGRLTARFMVQGCLMLLLASLLPFLAGLSGPRYVLVVLAIGGLFIATAIRFLLAPSAERARQVLWASLVYLPVVLTALLLDGPWLILAGS
ncbi:MAG: heme o synthase [Gemmatales bacterium]|nr:heme o synthase [Gemmatales bacterium]MDW8385559.1 heme o synthase [Gemmatales bacterium]